MEGRWRWLLRALSDWGLGCSPCCGESASSERARLLHPPSRCEEEARKLRHILDTRPYLSKSGHVLHQFVKEASQRISAADQPGAANALAKLSLELRSEEASIGAAFNKFDHNGDGHLQREEVKFMLDYLGFPCTDRDVRNFVELVDTDGDGTLSLDEVIVCVGASGGSGELFRLRREQIEARCKGAGGKVDKETLKIIQKTAGFSDESLAYWQLTANPSEFEEVKELKPCQRKALEHIRNMARQRHVEAFDKLLGRAKSLGISEVDLHMALAWVRELAPIIIHIKLDKLGDLLYKDTHYRNQFETKSSGGLLNLSVRRKWERDLFGDAYETKASAFDRPKYAVQAVWNDPRGVVGCEQYGESYLILKDVRLRCTLSPQDSGNLRAERLAVPDYYAHVLMEYSDKELKEMVRVAREGHEQVGNSKSVITEWGTYKEAQIHGAIDLKKHVERLVVHEKLRSQTPLVNKVAAKHGWKVTWMDDMRKELGERAGGREMGQKQWKEKIAHIKKEIDTISKANKLLDDREHAVKCKWFYYFDGWQAFDADYHRSMESMFQAYQASKSHKTANVQLVLRSGRTLLIDFERMRQQVKGNFTRRQLLRLEL